MSYGFLLSQRTVFSAAWLGFYLHFVREALCDVYALCKQSYDDSVSDVKYFGRYHVFNRRKMSRWGGGVVVKRIQFCLMKTKWLLCTPKFAYISGYIVLSSFLFFISHLSRLGNANFLRSQIRKFIYLFISPYFTHCRRCISGALIFS